MDYNGDVMRICDVNMAAAMSFGAGFRCTIWNDDFRQSEVITVRGLKPPV